MKSTADKMICSLPHNKKIQSFFPEESESFYRTLAENIPGIVYRVLLREGNRMEFFNRTIESMTGYCIEELEAEGVCSFESLILPEDRLRVESEVKTAVRKGLPLEVEYRLRRKDGSILSCCQRGMVIQGPDGKPLALGGVILDISEKKAAETALRESEDKFKHVFDYSATGKSITLPSGVIQVNQAFCDMLGYLREDLQNRRWQEITHPDDAVLCQHHLDSLLSGEKPFSRFVKRYIHKNGSIIWADVSTSLRRDSDGHPLYFMTDVSDITTHKRLETESGESLSLLQATLESTADGLLVVNREGRVVQFNKMFAEMWRIPEDVLATRNDDAALSFVLDQLVYPEQFVQKVRKLYVESDATSFDVLEFKDGRVFERYSQPQKIAGKSVGRVWSFRDITQRTQAEKALRESEDRFRKIFEEGPIGMAIFDTHGSFVQVNSSFCRIMGYTEPELTQKTFIDITHPEHIAADREFIARINSGELSVYKTEKKFIRKNKDVIWGSVTVSVIRDGNGQVQHHLVMVEDITEHKKAEQFLRDSEEKYSRLVNHSLMGIGVSRGNRVLYANPALLKIFGYDNPEEFIRIPLLDHVTPGCREAVVTQMKAAVQGGIMQYEFEYDILRRDGKIRTLYASAVHLTRGSETDIQTTFQDITERKSAEEALRENERKYRELVENANSIILRRDVSGRITFFNEFAQTFFGYTAEEILGRNIVGTIVPVTDSSGRDLARMIREIGRHPERYPNNQNENMRRSGERVWIAWTNKPVFDENGAVSEILCIGNDITERKQAEQTLRESEERFRTLIENSSDAFSLIDRTGTIIYRSPSAKRIEGLPDDEIIGTNLFDRVWPEDLNDIKDIFTQMLHSPEKPLAFQYRVKDPKGLPRWMEGVVTNLLDEPVLHSAVVNYRDVTERKLAELSSRQSGEALRESEERFRALFEQASVGVALVETRSGKFLKVNRRFCEIVGFSPREMFRLTLDEITHPEDAAAEISDCKAVREGKNRPISKDKRYRHKNGSLLWVNLTISPMRKEGEKTDCFIAVIQDVTERKRMEERIRADLQEKETLLKEIHHRVKNNLQIVSSLMSLQSRHIHNPKMLSNFIQCQNRIKSMALIHQILYGSGDLSLIPFIEYINSLVVFLRQVFVSDPKRITFEIQCEGLHLNIDQAVPCGLIINELVSNAFKHAFPDNRKGRVSVEFKRLNRQDLELIVRDNGSGLPAAVDFKKADSMGFYLLRMLAENQLGGTIEMRRVRGTEFRVRFKEKEPTSQIGKSQGP